MTSLLVQTHIEKFETSLQEYMAHRRAESPGVDNLFHSMNYSLFNGGKRFRPLLCYAVGEALGAGPDFITPFAMAVECIHTYSLIHDDLPCMDNDDVRRGQPTNHKRFSEDIALLAGDALLTEAPLILARAYGERSGALIESLCHAAGASGRIRGQVLDLGHGDSVDSLESLINLHEQKPGQLIAACFVGPALILQRPHKELAELGFLLGLAFQVKDDVLDSHEEDNQSFVAFLGLEGAENYLQSLTEKIQRALREADMDTPFLRELIEYNLNRKL